MAITRPHLSEQDEWTMAICDLHLDIALRDVVKIAELVVERLSKAPEPGNEGFCIRAKN